METYMNNRNWILAVFSMLMSITVVVAQDACPTIVADALAETDAACLGLGRNEACFGNVNITTTLSDETVVFQRQGDIVELTAIERMTLSPYDEATGAWGVALMNVQANIPGTVPGQGVTFLLFGDVDITNAGDAMEAFYFSSGVGTADCQESGNGIMINTPEGAGTVTLVANDVTIDLGSTAVLTAQPDDVMTIALTEGTATVTADGESQSFEGGFQVSVPVDEELQAVGAPSEPEPIPEEDTENLPDITEFVEDVDESDDTDDSDTDDASTETTEAGGNIVPLSGNWAFAVASVVPSDGCPPGMAEAMTSVPIPASYVEFDETFSLQTLMENTAVEGMPAGIVYANPAPNVYTMSFTQEGVSLSWTMTLVSETEMSGEYSIDMSNAGLACSLTVTYSVTNTGS